MNELIQQIVQRTGIPQDKAQTAIEMVISHLKGRLPAPIASQLDNYVSGAEGGTKSSVTGVMSGLMGKKDSDAA